MRVQDEFLQQDAQLIEMLFESNMSVREIALSLDWSQSQVSKRIKELGLSWVKRSNRKFSRGHSALIAIVTKLLPGVEVMSEYHLGERLFLDIYCPKYKLGLEFHGRQHFEYTSHFHPSYDDFLAAQERDQRKIDLCDRKGITLVVFCYNEKLNEDDVYNRILHAIRSSEQPIAIETKYKTSLKGNPIYEEAKRQRKEWEKEFRKRIKLERQEKYG